MSWQVASELPICQLHRWGVRLTLLEGILRQTTDWDDGDLDSGSKAQKTSSPRKLAEHFRESLVFQEAPIAFPEYLFAYNLLCRQNW